MESERRTNIIGAELDDSRLSDILSASQIKVTDTLYFLMTAGLTIITTPY
ncbi:MULTISPECIES: hypothetical protein [Phocaeicola]|nr:MULTISPECIES: hypothetical protein [Phocaeicola]MCE8698160.1 hypothetical protein [Phocaeicola vulgatus]MCE9363139.1 hypothetical protein [Phocaeicola vulgatus]